MIKRIIFVYFLVICTSAFVFAQKISNIDFDLIKHQTEDSTSVYFYPSLLKKALSFDSTMTDTEFTYLYYGKVFTNEYAPYSVKNDSKFMEYFKSSKYAKAIKKGEETLLKNGVDLDIIYGMAVCFSEIGNEEMKRKYFSLYKELLNVIYRSGNGKSIETAYVVIAVSDEYAILRDLKLTIKPQALIGGTTDLLKINTTNQPNIKGVPKITELYFNIEKPFLSMLNMFGK